MISALGGCPNPCQDYQQGGFVKTKEFFASFHQRYGVKQDTLCCQHGLLMAEMWHIF